MNKRNGDAESWSTALLEEKDKEDEPPPQASPAPPSKAASPAAAASAAAAASVAPRVPLSPSVWLLCLVGFLMSFKPSEPFLTPYLRDDKQLSAADVDDEIYPVWSYAFLCALLPVGGLTVLMGPRAVVFIGLCARLATRGLLLWGEGVTAMQWSVQRNTHTRLLQHRKMEAQRVSVLTCVRLLCCVCVWRVRVGCKFVSVSLRRASPCSTR